MRSRTFKATLQVLFVTCPLGVSALAHAQSTTAYCSYSESGCANGVNSADEFGIGGTGESTAGIGWYGNDSSSGVGTEGTSYTGPGVVGISYPYGAGPYFYSSPASGVVGVAGTTSLPSVTAGVVGSGAGSGVYGVYGEGTDTDGVHGVYDGSSGYNGVVGEATADGGGVYGSTSSSTYNGVKGENFGSGAGVNGTSASGFGVYAQASDGGVGVYAASLGNYGYGVQSVSSGGRGVYASTSTVSSDGYGVYAEVTGGGGYGVYASSSGGTGVRGEDSSGGTGVWGDSSGWGVVGSTSGSTSSSIGVFGSSSGGSSSFAGYFGGNVNIESGCLKFNGSTYAGSCSSDRRLKKNIETVKNGLDRLVQLRGVTYEWKNPAERGHERETGTQTGFIAQEVESVFPNWVAEDKTGFKTLNIPPREFAAYEVDAFRTVKAQLDAEKKRNDDLESRMDRLENGTNPPRAGFTYGNGGWGVAGLAVGLSIMARRKQSQTAA